MKRINTYLRELEEDPHEDEFKVYLQHYMLRHFLTDDLMDELTSAMTHEAAHYAHVAGWDDADPSRDARIDYGNLILLPNKLYNKLKVAAEVPFTNGKILRVHASMIVRADEPSIEIELVRD